MISNAYRTGLIAVAVTVSVAACTNTPVNYPTLNVTAQRNATQSDLNISGSGYTPGGSVSLFINNLPLGDGTCAPSVGKGGLKAKPDGTISYYLSVGYYPVHRDSPCKTVIVARDNTMNIAGATGISSAYWFP